MKNLLRNFSFFLIVLSAIYLSGCSGGGGSNTKTANVTVTSNVDGADVSILSYNTDGSKKRDDVSGNISGSSFETPVKMDKNGGYIVVNVSKDGFSDWSKTVTFDEPKDITVNANLTPIQSQSVIPVGGSSITVSSTGKKVIKIALVKRNDGKKIIATGNQIRAANGIPEYTMEIPLNLIPSDTKALKVGLSSFDPKEDADKFPGDYMDENGNRLLSLGFNFVDIRDAETNQPIFRNNNPSTTQSENVRITRWINENVCDNLQGDFCTGEQDDNEICSDLNANELAGYNVPFYRYDETRGIWELLGVGTIDINNDGQIDSNDAVDSSFNAAQTCQNNSGFNTIIVITNPDFRYCNLDYPVVNPPTELCIIKTFKDTNGQPFTIVNAWLEDNDSNQSFLYSSPGIPDTTGTVKITTWNIKNDSDTTANLVYSYPLNIGNEIIVVTKKEEVTLGTPDNCETLENTIDLNEKPCKVMGTIKYSDNSAAKNVPVFITDDNLFFTTTVTDDNGNFEASVLCETPLTVYVSTNFESVAEFNANGVVNGDEISDELQDDTSNYKYIVTLQEISLAKPKYSLYVFKQGSGNVTSNPSGINCGNDCSEDYEQGTTVTLTASPSPNHYVDSWAGCDSVSSDKLTCTVSMNYYRFVSVVFKSNVQYTLDVTVSGNGSVVSNPVGINCQENSGTCSESFDENAQVNLVASPDSGYTFSGWGGDCSSCGTNLSCTLTMNANKACTAEFSQVETPSVDMTGVWEGSYEGNDGSSGQICVELQQTGNNLSGNLYIQGEGLVGSVTGTLNGNNIEFGVAAGVQYSGTVSSDGNSANGTYDEDNDNNSDGTWSITKTDKSSCGWLSGETRTTVSNVLAAIGYYTINPDIFTEIPQVTVNIDGTPQNDWYLLLTKYEVNLTSPLISETTVIGILVKSDNTRAASFAYSEGAATASLVYYQINSDGTLNSLSTDIINTYSLSNENYESTPIYTSGCYSNKIATITKGTADLYLSGEITENSTNKTFEIPTGTNVTIYKYTLENCP